MISASIQVRKVLVYAIAIVVALVAGYQLATPDDLRTVILVFGVFAVLATPILMRWYHPLLVLSVNAAIAFTFLPGAPALWICLTICGFLFTLLNRSMDKLPTSLHVPAVSWSLVFLGMICLITAYLTGGMGLRATGSGAYGGKRYIYIFCAIMIYFVLVSRATPISQANLYLKLFFFSSFSAIASNIVYELGPSFYFFYAIFPPESSLLQMNADNDIYQNAVNRFAGFSMAGITIGVYLICRYGAVGLLDIRKLWRSVLFTLAMVGVMLGGYRSGILQVGMIFCIQFYLEKGFRKPVFAVLLGILVLSSAVVLPNLKSLPFAFQRTLSFLPMVEVDPVVKYDAQGSTEWRLGMWEMMLPEIPKYLILGKGYSIDPTEQYLLEQSVKRGYAASYEVAMLNGDFHNGPLSLLIPLGVFGVITFYWFTIASIWVLYNNYKHGPPELHTINGGFLSYFIAKTIFFMFLFGSLYSDLMFFATIVGLSISLNGGIAKPKPPAAA